MHCLGDGPGARRARADDALLQELMEDMMDDRERIGFGGDDDGVDLYLGHVPADSLEHEALLHLMAGLSRAGAVMDRKGRQDMCAMTSLIGTALAHLAATNGVTVREFRHMCDALTVGMRKVHRHLVAVRDRGELTRVSVDPAGRH